MGPYFHIGPEKDLIPLSLWRVAGQHADRHGAGKGAEFYIMIQRQQEVN